MADATYNLKFTLSNGQELNAGNFTVPQGPKGDTGATGPRGLSSYQHFIEVQCDIDNITCSFVMSVNTNTNETLVDSYLKDILNNAIAVNGGTYFPIAIIAAAEMFSQGFLISMRYNSDNETFTANCITSNYEIITKPTSGDFIIVSDTTL